MSPHSIALDSATVCFGDRTALSGFSGSFAPGTITAIIGGDGAGKSTLLRLLAGRLTMRSGTSVGLPLDRSTVGYQPADSGVWRNLSVAENIEFVGRVYGLPPARTRSRAEELLHLANLDRVTDRLAGQLSGGMRQKLGVVLATLHNPDLVLFDEPTTGVDPISRAELWSLIASTAADGATVLFATTYLDEAERASRLFLLGDGNLLAAGNPDEVIRESPGRVWQAPISSNSAKRELDSPTAWRRGGIVYRWDRAADGPAPEGFTPAPGDLENTSIALLLDQDSASDHSLQLPEELEVPKERRPFRDGVHAEPLVQAEAISRSYGSVAALSDVSLAVGAGEIVGLLGGNGAGKTTLMRVLLGLETSTTGLASLFGGKPSFATRRRLGYVAQGLGLYPSLTALENLEFAASVQRVTVGDGARDFAVRLGHTAVGSLPLGTRRILAYLAASVHGPDLLVLDEPTSGMDALTRARLWRRLRASADGGVGILVTTHYMQEASQCDRLVILTDGEVTATGTVPEIVEAHSSLTVTSEHWEEAFVLLRGAGIPALLDGRTLRLPGAERRAVADALAPLVGGTSITEGVATLEETMMLAARGPRSEFR